MTLTPLLVASLFQLTAATSTCEEMLACGTFEGRAQQNFAERLVGDVVDEHFEISDAAPGTVRIVERTQNLTSKNGLTRTWDFVFAEGGAFKILEIGEGESTEIGAGTCDQRACTFALKPVRGIAAGEFKFSNDEFYYAISEIDRRDQFVSRFARLKRRTETPRP